MHPVSLPADPSGYIRKVAVHLRSINTKGDLGEYIATLSREYGMYDLQRISGKLEYDLRIVPDPYRSRIKPFMREWIFGRYHSMVSMYHSRSFNRLKSIPVTDPVAFHAFCEMLPEGCMVPGDENDPYPPTYVPWYHLFMYLMAAFAMYVLDEPGHPVGMPFPGGDTVRRSAGRFYCPIRDKEEEIFFSICNFCPALQEPET